MVVVGLFWFSLRCMMRCDYCGDDGDTDCDKKNCKKGDWERVILCSRCKEKHGRCRLCQVICREHSEEDCGADAGKMLTKRNDARVCGFCGKREMNTRSRMKVCGRCLAVGYCGGKCQAKDWPVHKMKCGKESNNN